MSLISRSGFDDFFSFPPMISDHVPMPVLDIERDASAILRRSSPGYEITEDDKQFQLSVDVPGVRASDMSVQVEQGRHGGKVLRLSGGRKVKRGNSVSETRFEKSFTMDSSIDVDKVTANLADGVMVITAPKDVEKTNVRTIAISEGQSPQLEAGGQDEEVLD